MGNFLKNNKYLPQNLVANILANWPVNLTANLSFSVALSGGIDSVVLLHLMHTIFTKHFADAHLDAIHINHNISPHAGQWADFCGEFCRSLNIDLKVCNVSISKKGGESLENNARQIRYTEFFNHHTDVIILAHHKFDQIETTLSQIFRGSDLHNIAAMRKVTPKQNKILWRPLLDFTKDDLEDYAKFHSLPYITDESNTDCQYLRNFVRHDIWPRLVHWDPDIMPKILNFTTQLQDHLALINEIALADIKLITVAAHSLDLAQFKQLSSLRQHNVLTHFIRMHDLPLPSNRQTSEFIRQLNTCQIDKSPSLILGKQHKIIMQKNSICIHYFTD
jgi:tRNA(Ile)-lysidine synthase